MGRIKLILCLLLSVFLLVPAHAVHAFGTVSNHSYVLPADAVHDGDLAVNANTVSIEGTVNGDLYVLAENVQIRGRVTGDVLAFAVDTRIDGTVAGDVRAFTQQLSISGNVGTKRHRRFQPHRAGAERPYRRQPADVYPACGPERQSGP
jgi:cytoskeletal protein CcmA (bactofilin family)